MKLSEAIESYISRKVDFSSEVILRNDGYGDYIYKWNILDILKPTQEQINELLLLPSPITEKKIEPIAEFINLSAENFSQNLDNTVVNLQKLAEKLDKMDIVREEKLQEHIDLKLNENKTLLDIALSDSYSIKNNIWTKIKFNSVKKDKEGEYNLSSFVFSPKTDGRYLINVNCCFECSNTKGFRAVSIYKNNTDVNKNIVSSDISKINDDFIYINLTATLDLIIGDYIESYCFQNSGINQNIIDNKTWLTITKI